MRGAEVTITSRCPDQQRPGSRTAPHFVLAPLSRCHRRVARLLAALVILDIAPPASRRAVAADAVHHSIAVPPTGAGRASVSDPPSVHHENEFPIALGSFATTLIGSLPERTANIRRAADALDSLVLAPGEVISFNAAVGPRTLARGYAMAPVILRETRQLQAGGGICQVSSTLLAAALLSGLTIVERHRHSNPVDYIALGEDATISWSVKDLKLRNDLEQRVRLRVELVGATLAARFEGEQPIGATFELATEERDIPGDPSVGSWPGREIDVYRIRKSGDEVLDREFLYRDRYPPTRRPG